MNSYVFLTFIVINVAVTVVSSSRRRYNDDFYDSLDRNDVIGILENISNDVRNDVTNVEQDVNDEEISEGSLPKNDELFEEDIIMDDRLRQNVLGVSKRTALKNPDIKWPNAEIVYKIDPSFAECARKLLYEAMEEYKKRTCITFRPKTDDDDDYVLYTSEENVCSSNIGRVGGMQKVFIGKSCCVLGTLLHENMHALGFIHEHSRPDRDEYVKVQWDNISKKERQNFNKYSMDTTSNYRVDYNLASVMHYRNDAFTKNGEDTIIVRGEPDLKFGQRIKFSVGDVEGINNLYNCKTKKMAYDNLFKIYSGKLAEKRKKDIALRKKQKDIVRILKEFART